MKPHRPAGDTRDDLKAIRGEIVDAKTDLGKAIETEANKLLRKPRKELSTSVNALQGGQFESNRRKF